MNTSLRGFVNKFLLVLLLCIPVNSYAEKVVICSAEFPGFTNKDGSGYYWDILRKIFTSESMEFEYASIPFSRCLISLEQGKVDGVAAFFKTAKRMKKFTYAKSRIHFSSYGLFYLEHTKFNGLDNIKGRVGKVRGYDFSTWLPATMSFELLKDPVQGIKMLNAGRIKYYAEDTADFEFTLKRTPRARLSDYNRTIILTKDLFSAFSKSKKGQRLANVFDKGLARLAKSGVIQEISDNYEIKKTVVQDFK